MTKISVMGAGTWGTSLAILLSNNGHEVTIWSATANEEKLNILKNERRHPNLPDAVIPRNIQITTDEEAALKGSNMVILSVPSVHIRNTAKRLKPYILPEQYIVNVAKGIEAETLMTLSEQIKQEIPYADVSVLSGPSHAEELSRQMPTTCVIGSRDEKTAIYLQNIFLSPIFRVYRSPDILGIELGGALKNVVALAAGIADGIGYGDNTKAALITRGLAEITRLVIKMGGSPETMYGLSGMGDLIVTCASMHSRNRRAGILIGQGKSMDEAMKEVNMVVEGVFSARAGLLLSQKYEVRMPIVKEVNEVLFSGKLPAVSVNELMMGDIRIEHPQQPF